MSSYSFRVFSLFVLTGLVVAGVPWSTRADDAPLVPPSITAADATKTVQGDTNAGINLIDLPVTGDGVYLSDVGSAEHGATSIQGTGPAAYIQYTPTPKYSGEDSFTYTISDGTDTATATVTVTVTPGNVNYGPVATEDSYSAVAAPSYSVDAAEGVLNNDTDLDNDVLTALLVTNPVHGTVALASDGSFVYTPGDDFTGTDSFEYKANDSKTDSNIVTVTITLTYAPVTVGDGEDLQAAIDAASPHSTITISGTPLAGDITITKPLALVADSEHPGTITGAVVIQSPGVSLTGLTITNPEGDSGVDIQGVGSVTLTRNTITSIGTLLTTGEVSGIQVEGGAGIADLTFEDNTLTALGTSTLSQVRGIVLGATSDTGNITATVTGTTINNLAGDAVQGIRIETGAPRITLTGNTLSQFFGITTATAVSLGALSDPSSLSLHENTFDLRTVAHGIESDDATLAVYAQKNFWGTEGVPTTFSSAGVVLSPWYATEGMNTLGYETTLSDDGETLSAQIDEATTENIISNSTISPVTLSIAANTTVTGDSTWDGVIQAPTATTTDTTLMLFHPGYTTSVDSGVEVGSPDTSLTLTQAARIVFSHQAGKTVGWIDNEGTFSTIDTPCDADTQDWADTTLPDRGDCYIDGSGADGGNMIVWTKHFTTFLVFSFTPELHDVHIASNNPNTTMATVGDTVTLTFTSPLPLTTASAVFEGSSSPIAATLAEDNLSGSISYTLHSTDAEGPVAYDISFVNSDNAHGEASTSADGSSVLFDHTAPVITAPDTVTVDTDSSIGALATYDVTTDDGSAVVCTPASGASFTLGTTEVSCSATDAAGNTSSTSFPVTITHTATPSTHGHVHGSTTQSSVGATGGEVLGASAFNFTTDLTVGMRSEDVRELQQILIAEGDLYPTLHTGYFGPLTLAAVKKYQIVHHVNPASGYVGVDTRAVLNLGTTPSMSDEEKSLLQAQIDDLVAKIKELQIH